MANELLAGYRVLAFSEPLKMLFPDLSAEAPLPRAVTLTLRVENLFDADYQSVFNFLSPRRTILAGARATF